MILQFDANRPRATKRPSKRVAPPSAEAAQMARKWSMLVEMRPTAAGLIGNMIDNFLAKGPKYQHE